MIKKTVREYLPIESLTQLYRRNAETRGEKEVFRFFGKDGELESLSYLQFSNMVDKIAAGLDYLGLAGKRIAVIGESSPEWFAVYLASVSSGGVIVPLDKELLVEEIADFLNFSEVEVFFFSKSFNKKFESISRDAKTVSKYIPLCSDDFDYLDNINVMSFDKLLEIGQNNIEDGYLIPRVEDTNRLCCMLFTSGTTGTSKCVMLSEKNLCSCINSACESVNFFPTDVIVSVLPLHHTYELACCLAAMNYGMLICINDSLKHVIKNFVLFKPTALVLVPLFVNTMYKKIWEEAKKKGKADALAAAIRVSNGLRKVGIDARRKIFKDVLAAFGGNLTKIVSGGAPLNPDMVKNFEAFGITIVEGYGITECSPLISVSPYYRQKKGSVGPAVPCCSVKIDSATEIDDEGRTIGEILVKGENVMLGYYKNPEATAAAFTYDGWYRTGDLGYMDQDGYIYITGRKKNVIVLNNGKNVFPEEIEEYLEKIDAIAECVVVGRKSPDCDEIVLTALVYPNFDKFETKNISEIAEVIKKSILEINKKLPSFKQIRNIEIRKTEFEKTHSRKIKRFVVK